MDEARARTRAQQRAKAEEEEQERAQSRRGFRRAALAGLGIGYGTLHAMQEVARIQNAMTQDAGGMTAQLAKQAQSWREMAVAANTVQSRAALQSQMADDMQQNAEAFRNEEVIQGPIENMFDMFQRVTGGQTIQQAKTQSFVNRQASMEAMARSNAIIAKKRSDFLAGTHDMTKEQREASLQGEIDRLTGEQESLGDPLNMDAGKLRRYQRLAAEIKALEPYLMRARASWQAQADAARGMMTPVSRISSMVKERGILQSRLGGNITPEERASIEGRINGLDIGIAAAEADQFNRTLDIGLMGPNGRRQLMREKRREEREIRRMRRMDRGASGREARAFQGQLVNPQIGREAALNAMAVNHLASIDVQISKLVGTKPATPSN
jgi:hypothetical protein